MEKIAVIGHFGLGLELANGQTIKTKIVTAALQRQVNGKVYIIDTHGGVKAIVPVILKLIKSMMNFENIIIMLTENGLKICVPIIFFLNKVFKRKIHYIVIGGWLPKFISNRPRLAKQLKSIDYIYVETKTMKSALENMRFDNIVIMPNCKKLTILNKTQLKYLENKPLKICTFSRVMKEKGIQDLIDAVKETNKKERIYELDIYGQVDASQIGWFESVKKDMPEYINYCGVIPFDQSVQVLKQYFMLIFPTKFYTEGIPGTIIDAYAAGVPILASRWENFSDVIDENVTGIGYEFGNKDELIKALKSCYNKIEMINQMKINCLNKSKNFTTDVAMSCLIKNL